ncbi:helix-turn-helix domain-containing protein [Mycolicibacterium arabiense]|uniref:helix-turn-helix domain-containing protein n=1 Tax=Mycolicibacterium arabiense TaxID=1286181 RepID=UPI0013D3FE7C|nr:helix-turn-helix domain-containing protein [Mycolicibacterium arabiense]MCV7371424.1 helix-turn-helix domain-containing protein [Mycolicibacterium arabiense]
MLPGRDIGAVLTLGPLVTVVDHTTLSIRSAARRLLDVRLALIVDRAVEQTIHDEPTYSGGPVSRDDLSYHMDRTMRLALTRLVGDDIPDTLRSAALEVGRIRAHQNVPLSSVLHAFRIDLKTLWEALIAEGHDLNAGTRADFLERSSLMVWEAVEANTEEVVAGYQVARGNREEMRSAAFDQLLLDGDHQQSTVENAARMLGLPTTGHYVCLVGRFPIPRPELVTECAERLNASGRVSYFNWFAKELRGIVQIAGGRADVAADLAPLAEHVCAVIDADGLADVPKAIRLARMTVHGRTNPGVARARDNWLHAVTAANDELSNALHEAVFQPLSNLTEHERNGILETVGDLVTHGGTTADIAARTYRHRNTVRKRLHDFTALTGFDLSNTTDLATTAIAFTVEIARSSDAPSRY